MEEEEARLLVLLGPWTDQILSRYVCPTFLMILPRPEATITGDRVALNKNEARKKERDTTRP